jgi:peptidoglycan/LPS O-acetylase OafA/YrhL
MADKATKTTNRDNNFNLLRMLAASAVLISHAYPLASGQGTPEPLEYILGISLGTLAVLTFFAISGYFISQSFSLKLNIVEFAVARVLRVYPGLMAALLLTVFVLGPAVTQIDLKTYFSDPKTLLYILRNLRLWPLQYELPGVFTNNPYPDAINGSLWTLAYEIACYAMVAAVGIVCQARRLQRFSFFLLVYATIYVAVIPFLGINNDKLTTLRNVHLLTLPFVIGMALFQFRQYLPPRLSVLVGFAIFTSISYGRPWFYEVFVISWCYGVFYLGFLSYKPLLIYNRVGDYSYGMYIYAFPVEQIIAAICKGCTPGIVIALALPITFGFAVLSWHLLEGPTLSRKSAVSAWLSHLLKRSPSLPGATDSLKKRGLNID